MPNSKKKYVGRFNLMRRYTKMIRFKRYNLVLSQLEKNAQRIKAKTTTAKPKDTTTTPGTTPKVAPEPKLGFELEEKSIYEYAIGIKNISMASKVYNEKSIYVSQPIAVEGNVMEVLFDSVEEHPIFDNVSGKTVTRRTSVEYYLTTAEKPSASDWVPILPSRQKTIVGERLFLENMVGKLRFQAEIDSIVMYRDGAGMKKSEYVVMENGNGIQVKDKDSLFHIYTIDYKPNRTARDPWKIDVSHLTTSRQKQIDVFPNGTNHNKTVTLSRYPYIDMGYINQTENYNPNTDTYRPFQVYLKNASIAGESRKVYKEVRPASFNEEVFTLDKTLYKEEKWADLSAYSLEEPKYKGFDYYNWKKNLMFSETFNRADIFNSEFNNQKETHGNAEIEVHYEYLVAAFRLKIILRRNLASQSMASPLVHEYTLQFKTQK